MQFWQTGFWSTGFWSEGFWGGESETYPIPYGRSRRSALERLRRLEEDAMLMTGMI